MTAISLAASNEKKPNCATAIRTNYIGSNICLGKMGDARNVVDLERDQADPRRIVEDVELQTLWQYWPD